MITDEAFVVAVVVTYEPMMDVLRSQLAAVTPQVGVVRIVDNASTMNAEWATIGNTCSPGVYIERFAENRGLAAAQNAGILWAMEHGATHILLLDQDSVPHDGMVAALLQAIQTGGTSVAAAGPAYVDLRTGHSSFFVKECAGKPHRWYPSTDDEPAADVAFLISSGSLISVAALQIVSGMRSDYFIDHVDTEWCLRARSLGFRLLGIPRAKLSHTLGDDVRQLRWRGRTRQIASHSPLRGYYMLRNTFLMLRDLRLKGRWRWHFCVRLTLFAAYTLMFESQRCLRARFMGLGLWHGLHGVGGRLDSFTRRCVSVAPSVLDPDGSSVAIPPEKSAKH